MIKACGLHSIHSNRRVLQGGQAWLGRLRPLTALGPAGAQALAQEHLSQALTHPQLCQIRALQMLGAEGGGKAPVSLGHLPRLGVPWESGGCSEKLGMEEPGLLGPSTPWSWELLVHL